MADQAAQGEFSATPLDFRYYDVGGRVRSWKLPAHSLAFTVCQVPVCYTRARENRMIVQYRDGTRKVVTAGLLDTSDSTAIFSRNGAIQRVIIHLSATTSLP